MEYKATLLRLKKENITQYIDIHKKDNIWPEVIAALTKAFKKIIVFQVEKDLLIFEEAEDSIDTAYKIANSFKAHLKWDKMIMEWMEQFPEYSDIKDHIVSKEIPIVFYFENGKMLH